jgi:hypothetical protein
MALADSAAIDVAQELRDAILTGRLVDRRTGDAEADDPAQGASWVGQRTVVATLLEELLAKTEGPRRPRALRLAGVRIVGRLNLEAAELACPLSLHGCWFEEPVILTESQALSIRLSGCRFPEIEANQLVTRGNLHLTEVVTQGQVSLSGANIGGDLSFYRANLEGAVSTWSALAGLSLSCAQGSDPALCVRPHSGDSPEAAPGAFGFSGGDLVDAHLGGLTGGDDLDEDLLLNYPVEQLHTFPRGIQLAIASQVDPVVRAERLTGKGRGAQSL